MNVACRFALASMSIFAITGALAQDRSSTPPDKPTPFSLQEALAVAYETNPQLSAAQAGLRATDENVAQANANWRPSISASGTYGVEQYKITGTPSWISTHPVQVQLGLSQNIFRGGRTYAEIGKAKAQVRSARAQLLAAEQTVLLAAVTAYMDVVRDSAIVNLRRQNVEVLRRQRDATALEFKAGSLTRTDVAQSEARLATAEADLTTAEGQLAISRSGFMQTVGRPAETLEDTPAVPAVVPGTEDNALGIAMKQNPALVSAKEDEVAANYAIDDAVGALLPQLSVQGGYSYSQQSYSSSLGAGSVVHGLGAIAQLNVPIYQGGAEESAIRQAKQLHAQAEMNVTATDRQVRDAVSSAWNQFQAAQASITSNRATEEADAIAFKGVSKEQQVGGRTILDVLNAQQELLNAQVAVVTSRRNALVGAFQVLAAEGALTAKSLGLKVKLYDPLEYYDSNAASWVGFGD
ncbi:MAG: TolC family outer membrane protein [Rhizomicrobium sp.]